MDKDERAKLIRDCYNQLNENGYMIFTAITKKGPNFAKGEYIGKDRYELHKGAKIFYYDNESVQNEFAHVGCMEILEINENQPMYYIQCRKTSKMK